MRRLALRFPTIRLAFWFAVLSFWTGAGWAQMQDTVAPGKEARDKVPAPGCSGRNLMAEIREQQPAEWTRIEAAAERTINARSIFWRIEGANGPPSHLFGTIHLSDDRVNALPVAVQLALGSATKVVLEVADLSSKSLDAAINRQQKLLVFADDRSLETLLTPQEQVLARRAIEKAGMPGGALTALKPWVVNMTLSLSDCERRRAGTGLKPLDLRLAEIARQRGIAVLGLETLDDQLKALAAVPDGDQLTVLRAGLKLHDRSDDLLETMVLSYLARQLGQIWPMHETLWRQAGFQPSAFASFQHELITTRNVRMRDAALPILAEGGAFIAVGALHLPGAIGLVELLRGAGYKVTAAE